MQIKRSTSEHGPCFPTWLRLTFSEFRRSFRVGPAPDGRDFLSLTLLYAILIALGVILISAHRGIVVNFGDSLLGRIEGHGSPIRVAAHVERIRNNIDDAALALINDADGSLEAMAGLEAFPLREAEEGFLALPRASCTRDRGEGSTGDETHCIQTWTPTRDGVNRPFSGWIVAEDNPMWREAMRNHPHGLSDSLTIVLNRNVMAGRLNMTAYRSALAGHLPPAALATLPRSLDEMKEIYLLSEISIPALSDGRGRTEQQRAPTAYRVVQVDSLPSLAQVAFLVLAQTPSGLLLAQESAGIAFDPYLQNKGAAVVYGVDLFSDAPELHRNKEAILDPLRTCLGEGAVWSLNRYGDPSLRFASRLPARMVQACLDASGLVAERDYLVHGRIAQALTRGETGWIMHCDALPPDLHYREDRSRCAAGDDVRIERRWFDNWDRADIYVPNRRDVVAVRDMLITAQVPISGTERSATAFELGTLYSDSISRFGYLLGVVDWIVLPIAGLTAFAVIYILGTQLFVLISRRRKAYGILLARGMVGREVRWMLFVQVLAAIVLGALLGFVIAETAQSMFASDFARSVHAETARTELGQRNPKLIDRFDFSDWNAFGHSLREEGIKVLMIAGFVALVSLTFVWLLLRLLGLHAGAAPIDLLK